MVAPDDRNDRHGILLRCVGVRRRIESNRIECTDPNMHCVFDSLHATLHYAALHRKRRVVQGLVGTSQEGFLHVPCFGLARRGLFRFEGVLQDVFLGVQPRFERNHGGVAIVVVVVVVTAGDGAAGAPRERHTYRSLAGQRVVEDRLLVGLFGAVVLGENGLQLAGLFVVDEEQVPGKDAGVVADGVVGAARQDLGGPQTDLVRASLDDVDQHVFADRAGDVFPHRIGRNTGTCLFRACCKN
mmetsp:Transcript_3285/g.7090  ORF Transcript_3285/g.7090 Transcript_3285/m.7090 type:complete len:242 (+) Transcript_3285:220-945(+)